MKNTPKFILREWQFSDKASLIENANNIKVWNSVRDYFPHPYTNDDAEQFVQMVTGKPKPVTDFAIVIGNNAAGGISIIPKSDVERITAEIGFWLGEKYWNKGIMTEVVKQMVKYAFDNFLLNKLYAAVFAFNTASQKVLQKAGFELEAILKQTAVKNGVIIDIHYYSLLKNCNC